MARITTSNAYRGRVGATGSCSNFCANICRRVFFGNPQCYNDCIACGSKTGLTMMMGGAGNSGDPSRRGGKRKGKHHQGQRKQQHQNGKHRQHNRHTHRGSCGCGCGGNCSR